jgi:hypothetical protein
MRIAWIAISRTIAPTGVSYLRDTDASAAGRRRSRAIANTPRVEATAAPTYTASMSRNTTTKRAFSQKSEPDGLPGAPSANSGAPATSGLVITARSKPKPATSAYDAIR